MFSLHRVLVLPLLFVFGSSATCFAEPASLTLYIHDDAGLNLRDLARTISELKRILRSAGVEPDVCVYLKKNSESRCAPRSRDSRFFDIRILPGSARHMQNVRHPPLGYSIVDERGGVYADVFFETIRNQASAAGVPVPLVLAYAASHEFGHLLLGANAHSWRGIMKATWERTDLIAISQRSLRFDDEQCRRIAECWKRNLETKLAQNPRLANPIW